MKQDKKTVVIRASAGTGKTFQLTNRYLGLIKDGVKPENILAVTFTRLAAGEILERVLLRLSRAAVDVAACDQLARDLEDQAFSRERCLNLLQVLTANLHRVRVETLDAYFAQLARSFSLEIGLPTNWEILEAVEDQRLRREALQQTIVDDAERTVARLVKVLFQGEARRNVSGLLFDTIDELYSVLQETEPAAWDNFPDLPLLSSDQIQAAIDLLEQTPVPAHRSIETQVAGNIEAARDNDWQTFVTKGLAAQILQGKTTYYRKELSPELIAAWTPVIEHARAVLMRQLRQQTVATYEMLHRFDQHYAELKQRHRGIRFDDVTRHLMQLRQSVEPSEQSFRLDTEISHLLLDEFQDTSLRQWQIIRPLAERITAGSPSLFETAWSSFFCVGDVKQAIYGWRGGRSEIFDALEKHLDGIEQDNLTRSYRSAPPIIETVNQVFRGIRNHDRLDAVEETVRQWSENFPEHETALTDAAGFVQLETAPLAESTEERIPASVQQETTFIFAAEKVRDLHELMPDRTIGILVRRNTTVARLIYELRKLGVKASEERGGNPLTDSAAVQVILSLLRLSDHPDDQIAAFHIATSPLANLPLIRDSGLDAKLERAALHRLSAAVRLELMEVGYGHAISGWTTELLSHCNARDQRRLQQLVELAFRYEPVASIRASEFLQFVESERIADPLISNVRVMTIHQSKGLEFDTVVLPELEVDIDDYSRKVVWDSPDPSESIDRVCIYRSQEIRAILPVEMQRMFAEAKNRQAVESLCLLYVAMTRAAHAMYMILAPSSKSSGNRPRTFAGLLHVALAPEASLDGEQVLYQCGDENWFEATAPPVAETNHRRELPARIDWQASQSEVSLQFQSPSTLEGGNRVSASQLLKFSNRQALERGTMIHGLFEQVTWIDKLPRERDLLVAANRLCAGHVEPAAQVADFRRMLDSESIARVLSQAYYLEPDEETVIEIIPPEINLSQARLEVHNERRFVVPDADVMLSGSIDRLVLLYQGERLVAADVVDFKTDQLEVEGVDRSRVLQQRVEHYRPQIEAYRRAVAAIHGLPLERIGARLVFVTGNVVQGFSPLAPPSPAGKQ